MFTNQGLYFIFFINSSIDEQLGCFQNLAIIDDAVCALFAFDDQVTQLSKEHIKIVLKYGRKTVVW